LFAQISPVHEPLLQAFPFQSTGKGDTASVFSGLCVYLQFMWEVGLPPSPVQFSSHLHFHKLSRSWLLGARPPLPPEPLQSAQLVYLQFWEGFPSPNLWRSVRPTLFPTCLYCSYCLLVSFSFFPWWRSVCPGGYAALAQGCLWEYCGTVKLTLSASSQAIWAWEAGGPGALLFSPFNMKWRSSAPGGGVEGSKFCLFLVILPAKCVSNNSPRFHYRRLAFCFLPLAAILESSFICQSWFMAVKSWLQ
jgi:hypothetical protein